MVELVEVEPGRFRIARRRLPVQRSSLPMPMVISDEMPPTEQVDGIFYTSKAAFRRVGRQLGLTEVGNEKFKPKKRSTDAPDIKRKRRDSLEKAIARYKAGDRPHG